MEDREKEVKEVAKSALGMPKWTIAQTNQELETVVKLAGFSGVSFNLFVR
jgi:hypothetical protein